MKEIYSENARVQEIEGRKENGSGNENNETSKLNKVEERMQDGKHVDDNDEAHTQKNYAIE